MRSPFTDFGKPQHFEFNVYLLQGNEAEVQHEVLDRLLATALPDGRDFNLTFLDGVAAKANAIIGNVQTSPFLADRRVVVVRAVEKLSKEEQQALASRLSDCKFAPSALLVLQRSPATMPGRGPEALIKAVEKVGLVVQCDLAGRGKEVDQQLGAMAVKEAEALGKRMHATTACRLVERVEPHWGIVANEVRKLALYAGERPAITDADVAALTPETRETVVFKLTDALAKRSVEQSLQLAADLYRQGEAVEMLLGYLTRHFRLLLQARWLLDEGLLGERGLVAARPGGRGEEDDLRQHLPADTNVNVIQQIRQQPWRAQQLARQARLLGTDQIQRAFERILHTDLQLKGAEDGGLDRRLALEMLCVDLCRL